MHANNSALNSCASPDAVVLRSFYAKAWNDLGAIRNGILVFVRDQRVNNDLDAPIRDLRALKLKADEAGLSNVAQLFADCEYILANILESDNATSEQIAMHSLDILADIEALIFEAPLSGDSDFSDISAFVEESFDNLIDGCEADDCRVEPQEEFEIDEETLEIFRDEAAELLETISTNIETLTSQPNDRDALWNIRRCAHTFKGAAGIVGLKEASELAHRVEDLLDQLAEEKREVNDAIVDLLAVSTDHLNSMTTAAAKNPDGLRDIYRKFDSVIAESSAISRKPPILSLSTEHDPPSENAAASEGGELVKPVHASIVRVALGRMDELLKISRGLDKNWAALAERFEEISLAYNNYGRSAASLERVASLFETQGRLTSELHDKLLQIRLVRFGMLATRLNRAVQVTCQEENKKAALKFENDDVEIDTQILDSLVEPLLHLLRNAVVHGIEPPETRRLIGKPETGQIKIRVENNGEDIVVIVHDDGRGISAAKLREKAVSSGAIDRAAVEFLSDEETFSLMFLRGVTTAEVLSMNAGRGVGMSIVKESIESGGGSISITSEAQKGTTFTIKMPHALSAALDPAVGCDQFYKDNSTPPETEQKDGLTVLIVDDSSAMRQLLTKMIAKAGWKTITAADGIDALESIAKNRPDIILTDLEMPRLNGYELLESLKKDDDLRDIPVVMITSRTGSEHRQRAIELGAAEFISKPFTENSITKVVDRLTSNQCE